MEAVPLEVLAGSGSHGSRLLAGVPLRPSARPQDVPTRSAGDRKVSWIHVKDCPPLPDRWE